MIGFNEGGVQGPLKNDPITPATTTAQNVDESN